MTIPVKSDKMFLYVSGVSRAVFHTGWRTNGSEWVIACGFTMTGMYGFFIIREIKPIDATAPQRWLYEDQRLFVPVNVGEEMAVLERLQEELLAGKDNFV